MKMMKQLGSSQIEDLCDNVMYDIDHRFPLLHPVFTKTVKISRTVSLYVVYL
jgi:hypothetical protein